MQQKLLQRWYLSLTICAGTYRVQLTGVQPLNNTTYDVGSHCVAEGIMIWMADITVGRGPGRSAKTSPITGTAREEVSRHPSHQLQRKVLP